jgi:hypothetical protein
MRCVFPLWVRYLPCARVSETRTSYDDFHEKCRDKFGQVGPAPERPSHFGILFARSSRKAKRESSALARERDGRDDLSGA